MVRFSTGANELINLELDRKESDRAEAAGVSDPSDKVESLEVEGPNESESEDEWSILGIGRVDRSGETVFDMQRNGVTYRRIEGAEHLNPPNIQPSDSPVRRTVESTIRSYEGRSSTGGSDV